MESAQAGDEVAVDLPAGSRVLIAGDLHLTGVATPVSTVAADELRQAIDAWSGPGAVVINGNLVDLLTGATHHPPPDPVRALEAHPTLLGGLRAFAAAPDRTLVVLIGSHDARLAWDLKAATAVVNLLGGNTRLGFAAELSLQTGVGCRKVRVEPGARFDPLARRTDPRNPADTPLIHHVVNEVLPPVVERSWLDGLRDLADPGEFPTFIMSRLSYRRLARHAWVLLLPFVLALLAQTPQADMILRSKQHDLTGPLLAIGGALVFNVVLVVTGVIVVSRRTWAGLLAIRSERGPDDRSEIPSVAAEAEARRLVTAGHAGFVTGHTREPSLTVLGPGFHANNGCLHAVVTEADTFFGLPPVFLRHRILSWVELEAGAELHVRLLHARTALGGPTRLERLVAKDPPETDDPHPVLVASVPPGRSWPPAVDPAKVDRRARRVGALAIAAAGALNVVSALTPPLRERLIDVTNVVPLVVPQTAAALTALGGVALLTLARGVRRGQRPAWVVACTMLAASVALHLVKGIDVEEAVAAGVVLTFLLVNQRAFDARIDRPKFVRSLVMVAGGAVATVVLSTAGLLAYPGGADRPALLSALKWSAGRMVGFQMTFIAGRTADFFEDVLPIVGIGLVTLGGLSLIRPVRARQTGGELDRARDVVQRHGADTLDWFALRSDKDHFFWGQSVVAYAVLGGVALVSPDPIGPGAEREEVWAAFREHADANSWTVAVLGAGETWLPIYRATRMRDLYMGDEAVVDVRRFSLEGGRRKELRQAVNRIEKNGYTITFHDPAALVDASTGQPQLVEAVRRVMGVSRRGDVERGFSMTLGRIFDAFDKGLLLAVAHDAEGKVVAFCQYVPAPAIDGFSLDLMRRDDGDHPNGITDFIVVKTIEHLREQGRIGLGLNFATMRAVLAGEAGRGLATRMERWLLTRMSDSMQIESLWRYNAKFDPAWRPRYAVWDGAAKTVPVALAVARAEAFWELPLVGRFLVPADADG